MATKTTKSPDNAHKAKRKSVCLKLALALTSLLAVFLLTQHPASTKVAAPNLAQQDSPRTEMMDGVEVMEGEVLVRFATPELENLINYILNAVNAQEHRRIGAANLNMFRFKSRSMKVAALLNVIRSLPGVEYAEPNYVIRLSAPPNDTRFGELWGLNNIGQIVGGQTGIPGADISAVSAWDVSTGSSSIVVGIVDTGVDYNHPDLSANIWSAPSSFTVTLGGQNITCPAGSHGFNAINNTCNPLDDNNHGTHCAGTIGGRGNNGQGVAGVNWTTSIMGLKFLSASGSGSSADAIDCIEFAIQAKNALGSGANVRILSNSWGGGGFSQALLDQINRANTNNMLFVAAAGNSNNNNDITPHYPSTYNVANVVAVAATDNRDQKASFSSFGATTVDLGAPGVGILSTVRNGGYSSFSGTSMATPHVAGAAVLVLSRCALNTASLKANILNNVDLISSMSGRTVTGGRLNVDKAIRACSGAPPPPPPNGDVFFDNFETSLGWTTNPNGTDTATTGLWVRGNPETTTSSGTKQLGTTVSGVNCLVTGAPAGASVGANDIDGGTTSIQSPAITLPSSGTLTLTFSYYMAHLNNSSSADFFRVSIVGGSTVVVLQELGAANDDDAVWATATVNISQFAGQTIRIRIEAADASGASLVEAGVDDVRITRQ
ncbi:MAG: S8 family serine peptidase [Acidobacteria bacterium]|nr:S8 family serine peptidase [Acidobacteriota bacterium]